MAVSRAAEVRQAVRALRGFHALGRRLPPKVPAKDAYGRGVIERAARRRGTNEDTIRKARAFADPVAGYSPDDLNELCDLIEAVQPGQDRGLPVFRPSHVVRLLSVRPKGRRKALQGRAIKSAWSTSRLDAEIAKAFGTRREGGRKPARARTLEDWLARTEKHCETWRRWEAHLDEVPGPDDDPWVQRQDLPPALGRAIRRAADEVLRLHRRVAEELGRHVPTYSPRLGLLDESGPLPSAR